MAFEYEKYLRMDKIPHLWCPGCGIGIVLKAMIRAVDRMGWNKDDVAFVSGIGCTSRSPGYIDVNTLHTTHGRALTFATGIKMAQPTKHLIIFSGDGDATAIGGNHFIHACRRNIDMTYVIVNNNIYGMTGGQHSPTTPVGAFASTTAYGNIDPSFDICNLAEAAGATYVARTTVKKGKILENYIYNGFKNKGFSVIEAVSNCHTQFGSKNKMADPVKLINWINEREVPLAKAKLMTADELRNKVITGEYVTPEMEMTEWKYYNRSKSEYCESYDKIKETAQNMVKK
ncbi:MAG: 2-oxoglutarate ferredoxin oxidoreductase subunit beta [Candidatus Delongbacteria bacterium]|nr:2-oxoglutarate ferredoxin oxidoreductase subunit beta [Candidatus Delongbacteria bacterium]MBN2834294.1 2-oxoglutarate ferredoxin oxidoreductase subunit beta [Candidatus Delongbacteria bacterium]